MKGMYFGQKKKKRNQEKKNTKAKRPVQKKYT